MANSYPVIASVTRCISDRFRRSSPDRFAVRHPRIVVARASRGPGRFCRRTLG
jgi:hypothetical protein